MTSFGIGYPPSEPSQPHPGGNGLARAEFNACKKVNFLKQIERKLSKVRIDAYLYAEYRHEDEDHVHSESHRNIGEVFFV